MGDTSCVNIHYTVKSDIQHIIWLGLSLQEKNSVELKKTEK